MDEGPPRRMARHSINSDPHNTHPDALRVDGDS